MSTERATGWSRQLRLTPLRPVAYITAKAIVGDDPGWHPTQLKMMLVDRAAVVASPSNIRFVMVIYRGVGLYCRDAALGLEPPLVPPHGLLQSGDKRVLRPELEQRIRRFHLEGEYPCMLSTCAIPEGLHGGAQGLDEPLIMLPPTLLLLMRLKKDNGE